MQLLQCSPSLQEDLRSQRCYLHLYLRVAAKLKVLARTPLYIKKYFCYILTAVEFDVHVKSSDGLLNVSIHRNTETNKQYFSIVLIY